LGGWLAPVTAYEIDVPSRTTREALFMDCEFTSRNDPGSREP
jgi:hypothetical protein